MHRVSLRRWLPFLLWLALVAAIIRTADRAGMREFFNWLNGWPGGDKAGHIFLIGTLAFLFNHALAGRTTRLGRWRLQMGGVIVAALMTVEEFSQIWIPSRTFDLLDLAANYLGVVLAEMLTRKMARDRTPFFGLLHFRRCAVPTWRGWVAMVFLGAIAGEVAVQEAYPFLAVNDSLPGGILVVEGWMDDQTLSGVLQELHRNRYEALYITGGPIAKGALFSEYKTLAELSVAGLEKVGVDPKFMHAVPSGPVQKDRTYSSAVTLKKWLVEHGARVTKINLMSAGAHSRRSRLLFQKAFGNDAKIGIVAMPETGFDSTQWWKSSEGVRTVVGESIAYGYARFLFRP